MKKLVTFALLVVMMLSFSACSGNGGETDGGTGKQDDKPVYTLADEVIVDNEDFVFTITSVDEKGTFGFSLNTLCENKTDKNLRFSWDLVSVNGYMVDPFWSTEVAAGKKANSSISFFDNQFEECGITSVDEVVFVLRVYDADDWSAEYLIEDQFTVYPTGKDAASVVYPERTAVADEVVVINNGDITFIIESVGMDSIWGYTVYCYIVNNTSETLMFSWNDVSVNGFMVDPFWATEVAAGKRSFTSIYFSLSDLEENGITEVTEIEFLLRAHESDNWSAPDVCNEVFTYNPPAIDLAA